LPLGQHSVITVLTFCLHAAVEQFGIKWQHQWVVVIQRRFERIIKLRRRIVIAE
jgi:hypothetical protein